MGIRIEEVIHKNLPVMQAIEVIELLRKHGLVKKIEEAIEYYLSHEITASYYNISKIIEEDKKRCKIRSLKSEVEGEDFNYIYKGCGDFVFYNQRRNK